MSPIICKYIYYGLIPLSGVRLYERALKEPEIKINIIFEVKQTLILLNFIRNYLTTSHPNKF